MLHIKKKNNVYASLHSDDRGLLMNIYEHFSRYVDGYMFTPKYKARIWDGKVRFYNLFKNEIPLGIVNKVIDYCKQEGVEVTIEKSIVSSFFDSSIKKDDCFSYLDKLDISDKHGNSIDWRHYQQDAIFTAVSRKRRKIASPTASGKSLIMYGICRYIHAKGLNQGKKSLIVVPTIALTRQLKSDFGEYSVRNKWNFDKKVSYIGGKVHDESGDIIISTWQSLIRKEPEWFDQFNTLIVDEAHEAKSTSLTTIGKNCNAEYRIGLSGSFESDETTELTLSGMFGATTKTISTREMIDQGFASQLEIVCTQINHPPGAKRVDYQIEADYLAKHEARNKLILDTAEGLSGNVLILFRLVEKQGKVMYEMAKKLSKKKIFFIYGGVDVDDRERIRHILETEKDAILLASYKTFSTGSNVKNLEHVMFGSPTKSYTNVIQSIGRGLRLNEGKEKCILWDFFDYICGDKRDLKKCNHTFGHFAKRIEYYIKEQHPYNIKTVNL